ncbi:MAG TPA: serine/threonine-protein kinase, partial [Thermoanaerobaculia bacterium]|nr:serine/threonine-protein kinase [Thermoanaerobaculia bacterium]
MPHGGYWDKIGNQFEGRWALHQLVLLTSPSSDIESLEWEPAGDDERGVDLWVNRRNGIRECHQCKSGIEGKASWSMAALRKERILEYLQFQVSRDPQRHRYHLISGTPAPSFHRLCDEARDSRDAETFLEAQVRPVKRLSKELFELCAALNLTTGDPAHRELVWSLLRSSSFKLFRADEDQFREMADQLGTRVDGDPMTFLEVLESWFRRKPRRKIDVGAVAEFLASRDCRLVRGATDRFDLAALNLTKKRREHGGLLRLEAEIALRQNQIRELVGEQRQILGGRWGLVRRIDVGGFAEIWQGEDLKLQESEREPVAVKILLAEKANDPVLVDRFYRGGRTAASIKNWRFPRVSVQPGEADGRHFYVMEYVEGNNLGYWLSKRRLPLPGAQEKVVVRDDAAYGQAAWSILASVGEALSFLHNKGLVHGDVKPNNILVNRHGMVKLCDFDLIYIQAPPGAESVVFGTLPYLAPEVMACQEPSTLSDQYSLAMTVVSVIYGSDLLPGKVPM